MQLRPVRSNRLISIIKRQRRPLRPHSFYAILSRRRVLERRYLHLRCKRRVLPVRNPRPSMTTHRNPALSTAIAISTRIRMWRRPRLNVVKGRNGHRDQLSFLLFLVQSWSGAVSGGRRCRRIPDTRARSPASLEKAKRKKSNRSITIMERVNTAIKNAKSRKNHSPRATCRAHTVS